MSDLGDTAALAGRTNVTASGYLSLGATATQTSLHPELSIGWRLVLRLLGDVLAVSIGLVVFDLLAGPATIQQLGFACGYVLIAGLIDLTHVRREWSRVEEFVLAVKVGLWALLLIATVSFLASIPISRIVFLSVTLAMIVIRPLIAFTFLGVRGSNDAHRTVVMVCNDAESEEMMDALVSRDVRPIRVIGRLEQGARVGHWDKDRNVYVGPIEDLLEVCRAMWPWRVVFGSGHILDRRFLEAVASVNEMGVQVRTFPRLFEEEFGRVPLVSLDTSWFLFDMGPLHRFGYRMIRRGVDFAAGAISALVFALLLPCVAAAIKLDSHGPIFYTQTRTGQRGRTFSMSKFRTMQIDAEQSGPRFARPGDVRATRIGRILRLSRIDELPQCVNLLRGEMSLIGPRPERPEFVEAFNETIPFYAKRHLIKPGLTGWAQVHEGYSGSEMETIRKVERDLYYLKHQSISLDLRIVAATVSSVLSLRGR